ncbi:hypothetical protein [Pseudohaliea rubra]|uniref:Kazal-like domain-containing protein n=1 Tax=Pseudohaliea rubra DSM 19751 TaxID=1265313 RepID=A0A095VSN4_9GAMM|nr:hypothetical protein [Pseudohaliea rubra]KGE04472.1 hypothetical protein HRUBRA_00937 [Pseudohaliea rubra DSM 19751]
MRRAGIAILALALGGCAAPRDPAPASDPVTACTEPRPQVCTMVYDPVCATLYAGGRADYASPCNACADDAVAAWERGSCEDADASGAGDD